MVTDSDSHSAFNRASCEKEVEEKGVEEKEVLVVSGGWGTGSGGVVEGQRWSGAASSRDGHTRAC